jgi:hypothetical protein
MTDFSKPNYVDSIHQISDSLLFEVCYIFGPLWCFLCLFNQRRNLGRNIDSSLSQRQCCCFVLAMWREAPYDRLQNGFRSSKTRAICEVGQLNLNIDLVRNEAGPG